MHIVLARQPLRAGRVAAGDGRSGTLEYLERAGKPRRQVMIAIPCEATNGMLGDAQLVYQHLPMGSFQTAIVTRHSNRTVNLVIALDNRFHVLASDRGVKCFQTLVDAFEI